MAIQITEFLPRQPLKAWVHNGFECAMYASLSHVCGYVRLSSDHPEIIAGERGQLAVEDGRYVPHGYDYLIADAPGGWTYGPDSEGWVGFDTGHGWDYWPLAERFSFIRTMPLEDQAEATQYAYLMDRIYNSEESREGMVWWTIDMVEDAVNNATNQFALLQETISETTE